MAPIVHKHDCGSYLVYGHWRTRDRTLPEAGLPGAIAALERAEVLLLRWLSACDRYGAPQHDIALWEEVLAHVAELHAHLCDVRAGLSGAEAVIAPPQPPDEARSTEG